MTKGFMIEGISTSEFKQMLAELKDGKSAVDIPDFELSTQQVKAILGLSYETIVSYTDQGLITNVAASRKNHPKYRFHEIINFKNQLPELFRKRK